MIPAGEPQIDATPTLRSPTAADGAAVWRFVESGSGLESNSAYCYMLMFEHHPASCVVAEVDGELVGFVLGYRPPGIPSTVFVWQIGVSQAMRGKGLGLSLLHEIFARRANHDIYYLEATVSPGNDPSLRLFHALARTLETECQVSELFPQDMFPESHESENLLRIGPIAHRSLGNDLRRSFS